jgi:hypothetical protein
MRTNQLHPEQRDRLLAAVQAAADLHDQLEAILAEHGLDVPDEDGFTSVAHGYFVEAFGNIDGFFDETLDDVARDKLGI